MPTNTVDIDANANVVINGTTTAAGGFDATAGRTVEVGGTVNSTNAAKSITLTSLNGDAAAAALGNSGVIVKSGGVLNSNGGLIKLQALGLDTEVLGNTLSLGNVDAKAGSIINAGTGEVDVDAVGNATLGGTLTAGLLVNADNNVALNGAITTDGCSHGRCQEKRHCWRCR